MGGLRFHRWLSDAGSSQGLGVKDAIPGLAHPFYAPVPESQLEEERDGASSQKLLRGPRSPAKMGEGFAFQGARADL